GDLWPPDRPSPFRDFASDAARHSAGRAFPLARLDRWARAMGHRAQTLIAMELLTEALKRRVVEAVRQEHVEDPLVIAKFFAPSGEATWFATEYDAEDNSCFGYVQGISPHPEDDEFGYFSLTELEAVRVPPFNLLIERDLNFTEGPFS